MRARGRKNHTTNTKMEFQQTKFTGGINLFDNESEIKDDEYRLLINGRQRLANPTPIQKSVKLTLPLVGNNQGGIAVGSTLIVFISGRAYYKLINSSAWVRIPSLQMDATARRFWTQAVPKSTRNYVRKRNDTLNNPILLTTDFNVAGNPAGVLVQDGLSQPWLIQFDAVTQTFVARETKRYADWSNVSLTADDREYVPIGKQMFMLNEKLYIVAPDGKSIYQSVTGRPLDFMVNVDNDGNKLPAEGFGGAASVSFAFDSDEITHVQSTNLTDTFVYATARYVRLVTLDYNNTILGEPTYRRSQEIEAGVVNDQSFVDNLGDFAFIDNDGIKSFNAVVNYRVEGRNSIFSLTLNKSVAGIPQTANQAAAISFDNYSLFYCRTEFGKSIAVYDTLRQKWVSIDVTSLVDIKQFVVFANGAVQKLYAIADDGIYEMFAGTERETAQIHLKTLMPDDLKKEHKGATVQPIFKGATSDGDLQVQEYVDEQFSAVQERDIAESTMAMTFPIRFPIGFNSRPNAINNVINFDKGLIGKKLAYVITWNTDASLYAVKITTSEHDPDAATRQTA